MGATHRTPALILLCVGLQRLVFAQEDAIDLSGLWESRDSVFLISQSGNQVRAVYSQAGAIAAAYGFVAGDLHFFGTLEGRTLRGTMVAQFPVKYKTLCPTTQWQQRIPLDLTVSEDISALRGRWKNSRISQKDCRVTTGVEVQRDYTRLVKRSGEVVRITRPDPPYSSLEAIPVGDAFRVEVTYDADPDRPEIVVTVHTEKGGPTIQAPAKPTDVPLTYRTDPIRVVEPVQP